MYGIKMSPGRCDVHPLLPEIAKATSNDLFLRLLLSSHFLLKISALAIHDTVRLRHLAKHKGRRDRDFIKETITSHGELKLLR